MRFVYPGAVYHLMAWGDGGKAIFIEKEDHLLFLHGLSRVCGSHGWRVHAWGLMGNPAIRFPRIPALEAKYLLPTPFFPPSDPAQWLVQGPTPKANS